MGKFQKILHRMYTALKSIHLALILIGYLIITSIFATLIPQGKSIEFYSQTYSKPVFFLITKTGFDSYFRSLMFLIPLGIFTLNLFTCTVTRIVSRLKRRMRFRPGADIIHIGLLIFIFSGMITLFNRKEGSVFLSPGDSVKLPNGYELKLESFIYKTYDYIRPRLWESRISINNSSIQSITVNKPLKLGKLNIFQQSYKDKSMVTVLDPYGKSIVIHTGEIINLDEKDLQLIRVLTSRKDFATEVIASPENQKTINAEAVFRDLNNQASNNRYILFSIGDHIDINRNYRIISIVPRLETGLKVVYDPGFIPILIGIIFMGIGLIITFIQKTGDKKL